MNTLRKFIAVVTMAIFLCAPAQAQLALADLQAKMAGSWLVTVEGENRTRTMVIDTVAQKAEGTYVLAGTFNFSDGKPTPFKDGELLQSSGNLTLVLTTGAGSVYTVTAKPDGTFAGTTKYANGRVKPTTFAKGATAVAAAPAAAVTEYDGKWSGDAFSNVGSQCVRGVYEIAVKDGKVTGTATFMSQIGNAVSTVTGEVRPDKSMNLRLVKQQQVGRSTRFQGKFDGDEFKAVDPVVSGGQCSYDVKLKKAG